MKINTEVWKNFLVNFEQRPSNRIVKFRYLGDTVISRQCPMPRRFCAMWTSICFLSSSGGFCNPLNNVVLVMLLLRLSWSMYIISSHKFLFTPYYDSLGSNIFFSNFLNFWDKKNFQNHPAFYFRKRNLLVLLIRLFFFGNREKLIILSTNSCWNDSFYCYTLALFAIRSVLFLNKLNVN